MKLFRKVLFWSHLVLGVSAGLVILLMSVTGVLLTYEKQMLAWAERPEGGESPSANAARMPLEDLISSVRKPGQSNPSTVSLRAGAAEPVTIAWGREESVAVNAYTGAVLTPPDSDMRAFFRFVTDWHRWLGEAGDNRAAARSITGASNLAFLFIVVSGLYLWFPRTMRWPNFQKVLWFRGGLSGKARDFNWHNVAGFWCFVPLFFVVLSGVVISYPWASNLVYTMQGLEAPAGRGKGAAKGEAAKGAPKGKGDVAKGKGKGGRGSDAAANVDGDLAISLPEPQIDLAGLQMTLAKAQQVAPDWKTISITIPTKEGEAVGYNVDTGNGGQPQKRSTFTVCKETGNVENLATFADQNSGQRVRSWMRFVHTGEYYGFTGQTIAGIVSAGGALLVWTGIALAWRRFRSWLARDHSRSEAMQKAA